MSDHVGRERLAILVHEVRSPVAALAAIREALDDREGTGREDRSELVRLVLAACTAIQRIVGDASLSSIERVSVDVGSLLQDAAATAVMRGARGLVRVVVEPDVDEASLDPVRIRQALANLLENALAQSVEDGEVVLAASVEGSELVLSVTDAGPGIPKDQHERIFEAGVRLGPTYAGAGLGLAVVKTVADAHSGRVAVRSAPGGGATITMALPLDDPERSQG